MIIFTSHYNTTQGIKNLYHLKVCLTRMQSEMLREGLQKQDKDPNLSHPETEFVVNPAGSESVTITLKTSA